MIGKAGNSYLLDTNIVVAYLNSEPIIAQKISQLQSQNGTLSVSSTILGELYFGAYKSGRVSENVARVQHFANSFHWFACDQQTSELYGLIKTVLSSKGKPIPENDIWIAATARQHGLILVTRDEHFQQVDQLASEKWGPKDSL
ncbi:MAG: type II toxin-antitoxin system VapC family toxin [Anaerolineae bacterium]